MLIVHDYMEQADGGSRLCLELGHALGAPLLCGYARAGNPLLAGFAPPLQLWPKRPAALQWRLARAFARPCSRVAAEETVLFSGSYAPLAVLPRRAARPDGRNLLYCHTPPRFLYDDQDWFARTLPLPLRPLFHGFCAWLRPQVEEAARSMDVVVANSQTVRRRIARLWGLEAKVVCPPCRVEQYVWSRAEGYYLSMSRLDGLKRLDVLIRAFVAMPDKRLVLLSAGPEERRLRALADGAGNIVFTGEVAEGERLRLLSRCVATLCVAGDEDFGMVAVESLAAGKPAIVAGAGGLAEIVRHGETGLCLGPEPDPEEVAEAVRALDENRAADMRLACREAAQDYDVRLFARRMAEICEIYEM